MPERYTTIEPAPAVPPAYSLFTVAPTIDDKHRFTEGLTWQPEWVGDGNTTVINPDTGLVAARGALLSDPVPEALLADTFVVWAGETGTTMGVNGRDVIGRVRRKLAAVESFMAAAELWDGEAGLPESRPLISIESDRLTAVASPATVANAFGLMEHGLAATLFGQRGMIHCTPQVLSHAVQNECVVNAGQPSSPSWVTPMGHKVVADAGYSGNGPGTGGENDADGSSQWMYGTATVYLRLGDVMVSPNNVESQAAVLIDSNDYVVFAHRPVVMEWNTNVHLAVEVGVGTAAVGGAS